MIEAANFLHFFAAHVSFGTFLASRKVQRDFLRQEKKTEKFLFIDIFLTFPAFLK